VGAGRMVRVSALGVTVVSGLDNYQLHGAHDGLAGEGGRQGGAIHESGGKRNRVCVWICVSTVDPFTKPAPVTVSGNELVFTVRV